MGGERVKIFIVGGGKEVDFLVQSLLHKKNKIVVINNREAECLAISHAHNVQVLCGDATKCFILEDAGIKEGDLIIALVKKDFDNFVICQLAKKVFGVKRTFSIVSNPKNVDVFKKLGITTVVSSTYILASVIEQMAAVSEVINYLPIGEGKLELIEISLSNFHKICAKKLADISFPANCIVGCVIRNGNVIIPHGGTILQSGDKLTILASVESREDVVKALTLVNK